MAHLIGRSCRIRFAADCCRNPQSTIGLLQRRSLDVAGGACGGDPRAPACVEITTVTLILNEQCEVKLLLFLLSCFINTTCSLNARLLSLRSTTLAAEHRAFRCISAWDYPLPLASCTMHFMYTNSFTNPTRLFSAAHIHALPGGFTLQTFRTLEEPRLSWTSLSKP